jgi:hypothetical protein
VGAGGAGTGGDAGAAGLAGSTGAGGAAGAAGASGAAGTSGGAGAAGTAGGGGAAGAAGSAGTAGGAGAPGTGGMAGGGGAGNAGASGGAGTSGGAGAAGSSGAAGAAGSGGLAGTSGSAGAGGAAGSLGGGGAMAGAGGSASCQSTGVVFTPRPSTVLILVDRGGSQFDTATTGAFFNIRSAVEEAIAPIEAQYRLGFAAYVGQHTGTTCGLVYDSVPFATHNAAAIETKYESLGPLLPFGTKAETPATEAIPVAQAALTADTGTGGRTLLFITSGATDFCDDGNQACPPDALTYQIQSLWAGSPTIQTLIVGLPTVINNPVETGVLQDLANAGAGQPFAFPTGTSFSGPSDLYYSCNLNSDGGAQSWPTLFAGTGKASPNSIATYSATGGTAPVYNVATTAVADVKTQVVAALAAARSCAFDLPNHTIDPAKLGEATVTLNGSPLAQDPAAGWSMPTTSELRLNGPACNAFRTATATISFAFPCDTVLSP